MHKWLQKWLQKCYCMHSWCQGCGGLYVNDVIMWYDATIFEIYILFKRDIDTWNMLNIILRNYSWAYLDMHINEKNKFSNHACIHMQFKFINGMITVIFISCTSACISPISFEASPHMCVWYLLYALLRHVVPHNDESCRLTMPVVKFVPKAGVNNVLALFLLMAWHRLGDKRLSEPTLVSFLTHIIVPVPERVKTIS